MRAETSREAGHGATRLARKLGTFDAVILGMGAMIGAGIFAVTAPAALAAGNGLLPALLVAAAVAFCNALSSAQLAARHPESGGSYVYAGKRLGPVWGYLAGWSFVVGKLASCAAMALTFASYAFPAHARELAVAAVLCLTAVNYLGVRKTALLTRLIVALVVAALALLVFAVLAGGQVSLERLVPMGWTSHGILQAAGLWFFAFAGYARLATLGEEVVELATTIPRAIPLALGLTLLLYLLVALAVVAALDLAALAGSAAPLAAAVEAGRYAVLSPLVRLGAAIASLGVLLSLLAGVSRTLFAMAADGHLPRFLAAVHPRHRVPHRAELCVGLLAAGLAAFAELRTAIGFSAFTVLGYYALTNAAALRLGEGERKWPKGLALAGLLGCGLLAFSLPVASVVAGLLVLGAGLLSHSLQARSPA